jgi:hypothetical protein
MDRAVLDAYGWTDLQPTCEFLLDYEDDESDDGPEPPARTKKKPWRYRWPDPLRDELLARLLVANLATASVERKRDKAFSKANHLLQRPKDVNELSPGSTLFDDRRGCSRE